jgi:hypothetical protein
MKKALVIALAFLIVSVAAAGQPFEKKTDNSRTLSGRVSDRQDNPLPNAVVYLTNSRSRAVKTYIDYEVYAQYNGHKSDTKTVSQFDNRQQLNINLKIDAR